MKYKFEDFELDSGERVLRNAGEAHRVEPQVFDLLHLLIANHGKLVSKDDINEKIWEGRIVSEAALSSRISSAREAVGDSGREQRLIKTVHGHGFRFVGEVKKDPSGETDAGNPAKTTDFAREPKAKPNPVPTVAVLPFDNMSNDPLQDHLADGMCEDIITMLGKVPILRVIARNSTFVYKKQSVDIVELGRQLNADYVLEGSVRKAGDIFRVTGQLIDASDGTHVWAERYDRNDSDIFALQDEMTLQIVSALQANLILGDSFDEWTRGTKKFEAWMTMMQANLLVQSLQNLLVQRGRELCNHALEIDPKYSQAHAMRGSSYIVEAWGGWGKKPPLSLLENASAALDRALELDPQSSYAMVWKALSQTTFGDFQSASELSQKAYTGAPTNPVVVGMCVLVNLSCGEYRELGSLLSEAGSLCPQKPLWFAQMISMYHLVNEDWTMAREYAQKARDLLPEYIPNYVFLIASCFRLGKVDEAQQAAQEILNINPKYCIQDFSMSHPFKDRRLADLFSKAMLEAGLPE